MKWKRKVRRPKAWERANKRWHQWFAWYPITISSKEGRKRYETVVWLQKVWRSREIEYGQAWGAVFCRYKFIEKDN